MKVTVISWNMDTWKRATFGRDPDHLRRAWQFLADLRPDIALVQEARPPLVDGTPPPWWGRSWPPAETPERWWVSKTRRWGSAVVCLNPDLDLRPIETVRLGDPKEVGQLAASHPGTFAAVEVGLPSGDAFVAISAYGLIDDHNPEIGEGYSATTLNRMLSDLTPLIDSRRGRRMVLGGDLNSGTQWRPGIRQARWGPMHDATMARIEGFGFHNCLAEMLPPDRGPLEGCPCGPRPDCRHVRTLRQNNRPDGDPVQVDYIFASDAIVDRVVSCQPLGIEEAWSLSDHCPVVATFEM